MRTIYQVFAEGPDGSIYCVVGRGRPNRWFYTLEEARAAAQGAHAFGNADIWITESRNIEQVAAPVKKAGVPDVELRPAPDVHLCYDVDVVKDVPGDHTLNGEPCNDRFAGVLHRKSDLTQLVDVFHEMGFRVTASRVSQKVVLDDPDFLPKEGT